MEYPARPSLLLTDADPRALRETAAALRGEGFVIFTAADLAAMHRRLATEPAPDALLLDLALAEAGPHAMTRALATRHPDLFLALAASPPDLAEEAALLELGADLYGPKAQPPGLLAARLRAALRWARPPASPTGAGLDAIPLGDGLIVEPAARAARTGDGRMIALSRAEIALVERLARGRGALVSREALSADILDRPWQYGDRAVDNLVLGLRRKLRMDADFGPIRAVRGGGYRLVSPAEAGWPHAEPSPPRPLPPASERYQPGPPPG